MCFQFPSMKSTLCRMISKTFVPFGDVCMTQLKYYLRWKVCTTSRYLYEVGYPILNSFLIPHLDTLYQLSQKCVTYRKYIHRSILHFSLGEVSMGKNIMCFLSWLACFLFFANIGYRACPSKVFECISSVCGFYGD